MTYEIKYRSEDEMKDSGIEWLSEMPINWSLRKLKYIISSVKNGIWGENKKNNENDIPCVRVTNFNRNNNFVETDNLTIRNLSKSKQKEFLLKKNDLLIEKSGGGENQPVGFVALYNSEIPAIYTNFMAKISVDNENSNKYLSYYFRNLYDRRINTKYINQTTGIQNINTTGYFDEKIPIPEPTEQQKIANFLDIKTAQFDSIISKKEKLMGKLEEAKKSLISEVVTGKVKIVDGKLVKRRPEEMKDSGVKWLGMIPKEWGVVKLKYLINKVGSGKTPRGGSQVYVDKGIIFLRSQNIYNNGIRLEDVVYIDKKTDREMINTRVGKGDILLNITGASIGRCFIYNLKERANVNQHVCIIRLKRNVKNKQLYLYILQSAFVNNQIMSHQTGSSREGLNFEQIRNLIIIHPIKNGEKSRILRYLNKTIKHINRIISKTQLQIEKLKSAKQSLISEAVTGKIDLRDWEIVEKGGTSL